MRHGWPYGPDLVPVAGEGSGPSGPGGQVWAGARVIAAGQTAEVGRVNLAPYHRPHPLQIRVGGGPVRLTVQSEYNSGAGRIDHTTVLGAGGGWSLTPGAAWAMTAVSLSAQPVTVSWALLQHGEMGLHAPWDHVLVGLVEGGAGAPGAWSDASDSVGPTGGGWSPPDRQQLSIATTGPLDFRLVDETGLVMWALWATANRAILKHPGRARLQARNPGGGSPARSAVMCWNRS